MHAQLFSSPDDTKPKIVPIALKNLQKNNKNSLVSQKNKSMCFYFKISRNASR